jgi:hypothetical protein
VTVEVHDDGVGFDPGAQTAGFGLAGMNERVYLAGGKLELASGPAGTLLRAQIPLAHQHEREDRADDGDRSRDPEDPVKATDNRGVDRGATGSLRAGDLPKALGGRGDRAGRGREVAWLAGTRGWAD